jgi:hypothetical protein
VHEDDPEVGGVDVGIAPRHIPYEVIHLRNRFHAGEAPAGHHDGQHPSPEGGIRLAVRFLEEVNEPVAHHEGIPNVFEMQPMLLQPPHDAKVVQRAEREDEIVIGED